MKEVNFGVIGFGTVGSGVVKLFLENKEEIEKRLNFKLNLKKVADKLLKSKEGVKIPKSMLTADAYEIINDKDIDIVVELVGGTGIAKTFILDAIKEGKHVVTANKALLSEFGEEIFDACEKYNKMIGFEASVGGVIPIIRPLKENLAGDKVESVYGIMNGTCNYILTRMTEEGLDFGEVLREAQKKGYAEANPSLDVDGIDAAHKLAILTALSFGVKVDFEDLYKEGITKITNIDIKFASDFGYVIKLLGISKKVADGIEARVHPTLIPKSHPLANVRMEYNAIFVKGYASGPILLYGKGAGMMPTASAILGDVIDIARNIANGNKISVPNRGYVKTAMKKIKPKKISETENKFYIRMIVADKPGVLAAISGILGRRKISIASVIQKGRDEKGVGVPLVIVTHETKEKELTKAFEEIKELDFCLEEPLFIRIEENI
ncbi:MAG: homoserine dehydrogenase [bacterium]